MTTTATSSAADQMWLDATQFGATKKTESADIDSDPVAQKQMFLQLLVAQILMAQKPSVISGTFARRAWLSNSAYRSRLATSAPSCSSLRTSASLTPAYCVKTSTLCSPI